MAIGAEVAEAADAVDSAGAVDAVFLIGRTVLALFGMLTLCGIEWILRSRGERWRVAPPSYCGEGITASTDEETVATVALPLLLCLGCQNRGAEERLCG
jgi:hypothetical protein